MGLDMYLTKRIKVYAKYMKNVTGCCWIKGDSYGNEKKFTANPKRISVIEESIAYWRKANAIHQWFVENVQKGTDDCREYKVSFADLMKLKDICKRILAVKSKSNQIKLAEKLLPTQPGFFFGSTDYDEWYMDAVKYTYDVLSKLEKPEDEYEISYTYQSSW